MYTCIININIDKELFVDLFDAATCHFKQNISVMVVAWEKKKNVSPQFFMCIIKWSSNSKIRPTSEIWFLKPKRHVAPLQPTVKVLLVVG